ncbi:MAG: hypothetical protein QXH27_00255 [Candidatus Micrarchaeia archaeon]
MKNLLIVLAVLPLAGASVSDVKFSFIDSSGNKVDFYPAGYSGKVSVRAEISDAAYPEWVAGEVRYTLRCELIDQNGTRLRLPEAMIGCIAISGPGVLKNCRKEVSFEFRAEYVKGGSVECFLDEQKAFSSTIPFAQFVSQPPVQPPAQPAVQPPAQYQTQQGPVCCAGIGLLLLGLFLLCSGEVDCPS